ncbi:hypothetical protein MPER_11891 [Moniliophthora perniciosa FA553]|nr:hypothetical protein MPER_11891 [Moniliophthora perniciosa FA553]
MRLCLSIDDTVRWFGYLIVDRRNCSEQLSPSEQQVPPTPSKAFDASSHDDEVFNDKVAHDEVVDGEGSDGEGSDGEGSDGEGSDEGSDNGAQEHEGWNPTSEMEQAREIEDVIDEFEEMDAELLEEVVFRTSFDLTELDQVTDPAELMKELAAFEK